MSNKQTVFAQLQAIGDAHGFTVSRAGDGTLLGSGGWFRFRSNAPNPPLLEILVRRRLGDNEVSVFVDGVAFYQSHAHSIRDVGTTTPALARWALEYWPLERAIELRRKMLTKRRVDAETELRKAQRACNAFDMKYPSP